MRRVARASSRTAVRAALAALVAQGCASVTVDADGTRHVTGLVRLTLPPVTDAGADALRLQALGLCVVSSPVVGTSLVIGYSDTSLAAIRNHSLVPGAALLGAAAPDPREEP